MRSVGHSGGRGKSTPKLSSGFGHCRCGQRKDCSTSSSLAFAVLDPAQPTSAPPADEEIALDEPPLCVPPRSNGGKGGVGDNSTTKSGLCLRATFAGRAAGLSGDCSCAGGGGGAEATTAALSVAPAADADADAGPVGGTSRPGWPKEDCASGGDRAALRRAFFARRCARRFERSASSSASEVAPSKTPCPSGRGVAAGGEDVLGLGFATTIAVATAAATAETVRRGALAATAARTAAATRAAPSAPTAVSICERTEGGRTRISLETCIIPMVFCGTTLFS